MSDVVVSQDDFNKLTLENERLKMGQADLLRRIEVLNAEFEHARRGRAMADIGIEKMIGKIDNLSDRTEKLESHMTWFIRSVTGIVITALGVLLFKFGGAKPV